MFLKNIYSFPWKSKSISDFIVGMPLPFNKNIIIDYTLFPDDKLALVNILEKLKDIDFNKENSFRIACDRFDRSYHDSSPEDKLLDLCIGFEALFCKGEKFSPMGHVVGLACSMLLGENNQQRENISKVLEKSFNLRNNIVHGKNYDRNKIAENFPFLEDYLRRAILCLIP